MNGFPNLADLQKYDVNRAGQVEVLRQPLFDTAVYATAGATGINFFATPQGQGSSAAPGNAGNPKTSVDTNMQLAGQLPAGQSFLVESVEVDIKAGSSAATTTTFALVHPIVFAVAASAGTVFAAVADVNALYSTGVLTFTVGSKNYLQDGPLRKFAPKQGVDVSGAVASTSATVGQTTIALAKAQGEPYNIVPITLRSSQNFSVALNWPVVVATPSGFNAAIQVALCGFLFRNSQ